MSAPWSIAEPGGRLSAQGFEDLQVGFREAFLAHDHARLGGAPLRGPELDPQSTLRAHALAVRELKVSGLAIDERLELAIQSFVDGAAGQLGELLNRDGGELGALRAPAVRAGSLEVGGALRGEFVYRYSGGLLSLMMETATPTEPDTSGRVRVGRLRLDCQAPAVLQVYPSQIGEVLRATLDGAPLNGPGWPEPERLREFSNGCEVFVVRAGLLDLALWGQPGGAPATVLILPGSAP